MSSTLLARIDRVLEEKNMLKHPFYQAWSNGKLTAEMLREYASQYYHFVKDFPRMVSAVHSNTPDIGARQELLVNLVDEELGSENHPSLWMRFATALGSTVEDVNSAIPLATTKELVTTMMDTCRSGAFQAGMATLYAYEAQIPAVSRTKIEGLQKFYGIREAEAIKFFTVHEEADVYHSRSERELMERYASVDMEEEICAAADKTATALWRFLDGVHHAYVSNTVAVC